MKQSSKRLWSLLVAILLLFAAFFIYFNAIQPAYEKVQAARGEVYSKQDFIKTQRAVVDQVKLALEQYEEKEMLQQAVSSAIPPGANQSEVAHQLNVLAAQSQLTIQSFSAATPTVQNVKAVQAEEEGESETFKVKPVGVLSFQIKASGTYSGFKSFMQAIENNIRIIDIKNVSVEQVGKPNQDFYVFTITVATYYQNP